MELGTRGIFAGLAAVALAGGAMAAAAPTARAATTQCGGSCITFAAEAYGDSNVTAILARDPEQGSPVTLTDAANFEGEDFESIYVGTTTQLWEDGLVPITLAKNWPGYKVYQYQFIPYGQGTSLCIGIATTAANGTEVSLQPCGVNDHTLWLPETNESVNGYEPIIAGTDTRSAQPYVLTTGSPGSALITYEQVSPQKTSQLWQEVVGVL
jgi:hypothetical protein